MSLADPTPIDRDMNRSALSCFAIISLGITFAALGEEKITLDYDPTTPVAVASVGCPSTNEFVDVYTRLQKMPEFKDNQNRVRDIAFKVSNGCKGAARRFFEAFDFLKAKELTGDQCMQLSIALSLKDDAYLNVFKEVMTRALDPKQLGMDLKGSVLLAQELALTLDGDPKRILADFVYLTDFCSSPKEMALSKARCIDLALRVVRIKPPELPGEDVNVQNQVSVAKAFVEVYQFLKEIGSHVGEALVISYDVIKISPYSVNNFKTAYNFGVGKSGLDLSARGAIQFALEMAKRTNPGGGELNLERLPASNPTRASVKNP